MLTTLQLTDICIKNGGDPFLVEIASREFVDNLVSILKISGLNHDVRNKMLRLVQNWSIAFEGRGNLSYVGEVYKTLQREGAYIVTCIRHLYISLAQASTSRHETLR